MSIHDSIQKSKITLLLLKGSSTKVIGEVCSSYSGKGVGLISASTSGIHMLENLHKLHVDSSHIIIVDCVSGKGPASSQIIYTKGPSALTDLGHSATELVNAKGIDLIILDSISSLLIHNKDIVLVRFLHDLVSKISKTKKKLVLTMLAKDNKGTLATVPIFMDAVVNI